MTWPTNETSNKTSDVSRTLPRLAIAVKRLTVHPRARQMAAKGDLSVVIIFASAMYSEDSISAAQCNTMSGTRPFPIPFM